MKDVTTIEDLAIRGAPPLFSEIRHVGRPNIGDRERFDSLMDELFASKWLTNDGPLVRRFEDRVAEYLEVEHCIAVVNGTVGLEMAVRALGMTGDVLVPSYTFVASVHALSRQGLKPVFVDIDEHTHTMDPSQVAALMSPKVGGILAVHLWGQPAFVDDLERISAECGVPLLFDAAHAFGCTHNGTKIGSFGDAEVFSFHATKFFNSFEGGAITTADPELAQSLRLMRNFGFAGYDEVTTVGTNGKMTEVCAAMGLVNLEGIEGFVDSNRRVHVAYQESLASLEELRLLCPSGDEESNYQYVVVEARSRTLRDLLVEALHRENVLARRYFWPGCHRMAVYSELGHDYKLPVTEQVSDRTLVLPSGSSVNEAEARRIAQVVSVVTNNVAL